MSTTTQCYGPKNAMQCQDALSTCHGVFQSELASPSALAVVWKRSNGPPAVGRMCRLYMIIQYYELFTYNVRIYDIYIYI